ncbi:SigE family RNA polymerase sigma factor [Catelliglobosispora koreensis]|uniref:SigE family RNA polymerase sigma factor n=1 Tax=Catelliglobosispora koreensis TaxID=129052 RepID=UPI0003627154|nr:SigE family RNA polymerase sigma factor [Catelliglobosispora koreensis]
MQDDLSSLYHASYRRLVAQVFAFTTDLSEAQDAVQEAFARALARRRGLSDIDAPEAWLRTVAINIVRRRWRRKQLLNTILLRERPLAKLVADAPEPDRTDLREALSSLPQAYREVIVLHYLADLPVDEVASILEVPVGTVKSRLSRGRDALKGMLDDVEAPPLAQVRVRAGKIRSRRQVTQATAALAFVCAVAIGFFPFVRAPQPPAGPIPALPPVYECAEGINVIGLTNAELSAVQELPGDIKKMTFSGSDGWLSTSSGTKARSLDGGRTWEQGDFDPPARRTWPASIGDVVWASADDQWAQGTKGLTHADGLFYPTSYGTTGFTATEWLGTLYIFTGGEIWMADKTGIRKFSDFNPIAISGDVAILDNGRLLVASDNGWHLSEDWGLHWTKLKGNLPFVSELRVSGNGGYVAIGLFSVYAALSADGLTWHKLPIR